MEFKIQGPFKDNYYNLMRQAGYHFLGRKEATGEMSFASSNGNIFPRFHLFLKINSEKQEMYFDLHLDQKAPSYRGTAAHSGEYDGETVAKEAERIKQILKQ